MTGVQTCALPISVAVDGSIMVGAITLPPGVAGMEAAPEAPASGDDGALHPPSSRTAGKVATNRMRFISALCADLATSFMCAV